MRFQQPLGLNFKYFALRTQSDWLQQTQKEIQRAQRNIGNKIGISHSSVFIAISVSSIGIYPLGLEDAVDTKPPSVVHDSLTVL